MTFKEKVLTVVANIPAGKTMSYKQVAAFAGNPNASRAVGMLMSRNTNPQVPCHRVIRSDGHVGGFRYGTAEKIKKLQQEGCSISP